MACMKSNFQVLIILLFACILGCSSGKEVESASSDQQSQGLLVSNENDEFHDHSEFSDIPDELPDLAAIRERGELRVIVDNSSTSYFIYRGRRMGFEYELLQRMADDLDLDLKILVTSDLEQAFELLNRGTADLMAYHLTITLKRREIVDFTYPHTEIRQVLVQRKPQNWRKMKLHNIEKTLIRDVVDLGGKEIHVRKGSSYEERLENLANEIGNEIKIVSRPAAAAEELINEVLEGKIKYTVVDEDIAKINYSYHRALDVNTPVSFPQQIAWAVRKESPELKKTVDDWLKALHATSDYQTIYDRYFKYVKSQRKRAQDDYSSLSGNISPYDDMIKTHAREIDWDWRLLAAQIYQESRFDPKTVSWAGAQGLMQLTKNTQKEYGLKEPFDPEKNIAAGVQHIQWLEDYWIERIPDNDERLKFVLASYNTGHGHVQDARKLAEKYGADPNVWYENVEKYLLLKSSAKYHQDPVVSYGYCKGAEPTNYVREILERHKEYMNFFEADKMEDSEVISSL